MMLINFILSIIAGLITSVIIAFFTIWKEVRYNLLIFFQTLFYRKKRIRFSISYLFRIKIDNKYLLIRGNRINQYQPIGGVYKVSPSANNLFNELKVQNDENILIDNISENDLRINVEARYASKVINWFCSRLNREVSVHREFIEELIIPLGLEFNSITDFNPEYIKTKITRIGYSPHFKCHEILIYDIFEVALNEDIKASVLSNINSNNSQYILCTANDIERLQINVGGVSNQIGKHTLNII